MELLRIDGDSVDTPGFDTGIVPERMTAGVRSARIFVAK